MRYLSDLVNNGMFVVENPTRGLPVSVSCHPVTAFIGPTPRGPIDTPVTIRDIEEFLFRFGSPKHSCRMEQQLHQYFDNGGCEAVVVRVVGSKQRKTVSLPGPEGPLVLEAKNPGPYEYLRVSVDYDNIRADSDDLFNLTVHRLRSLARPHVEEQEIFQAVSTDRSKPEYVGNRLTGSGLLRVAGSVPQRRPAESSGSGVGEKVSYIYCSKERCESGPPADYDLIGSEKDGTGLFALNQAPQIDFVVILPGDAKSDLGPVVLFAAERYCRGRNAMLIVDPPLRWDSVDAVIQDAQHGVFCSPNMLTYFPRLRYFSSTGTREPASAAGAIAGVLARNDPGTTGTGVPGENAMMIRRRNRAACDLEDYEAEQLVRFGINPLFMAGPGRVEFRGMVTTACSTAQAIEWNSLKKRRAALFIINSIIRSTRWAAFQSNAADVWEDLHVQIDEFLKSLQGRGVLAGSSASDAFYVKCDIDTNSRLAGQDPGLSFVIGIALSRPGAYLAFRFQHDQVGCDVTELVWQPGYALAG